MTGPTLCPLSTGQLTGKDQQHLVSGADGMRLLPACRDAYLRLRADAADHGFDLRVVSSYRSFERQLEIWNSKAAGRRPVHDDYGNPVAVIELTEEERLWAILRFSALPGASRHHWGTDLDVYDAAAVPADYAVGLLPSEVAPGGVFDPFHNWLDQQLADKGGHGFYRPYDRDRGGVAPERWHISFAPVSVPCQREISPGILLAALDDTDLILGDRVRASIQTIYTRFVEVPESLSQGFI